ncbi:hypothetical protein ACFQH6_18870 [Halobacteriaceae archaeon GCM10025711]
MQSRLTTTKQVEQATITDANGHLELRVEFDSAYYPGTVNEATLTVRWYTNDDFKIQRDSRWSFRPQGATEA